MCVSVVGRPELAPTAECGRKVVAVMAWICGKTWLGCVANPEANRVGGECGIRCNFAVDSNSGVAVERAHLRAQVRNEIRDRGWKTW